MAIFFIFVATLALLLVLLLVVPRRNRVLAISTDVNSGDVDDSFAITYIVSRGFLAGDRLTRAAATIRWFAPLLSPFTVRLALESRGDLKLLIQQLRSGAYGPLRVVKDGFISANYEKIEVYQSGYKVVFPRGEGAQRGNYYELVPTVGSDVVVDLLVIAGPASCPFTALREIVYVGRVSGRGIISGANASEQSRLCIENGLRNGAKISQLSPQFSRGILCPLPTNSPHFASAAQLQLNPWAFSFLQSGDLAQQFAESNKRNGALLLAKLGLTYDKIWRRLNVEIHEKVSAMADRFDHWEGSLARDRILWAVANFGGKFPWKTDSKTSVSPPFSSLSSIEDSTVMEPLELFEFRVRELSRFVGQEEERVRQVLSHTVLYDLYAIVLLKYGISPENLEQDHELMVWFINHLQSFVNSIH